MLTKRSSGVTHGVHEAERIAVVDHTLIPVRGGLEVVSVQVNRPTMPEVSREKHRGRSSHAKLTLEAIPL
jgi:hypothetical protein